MRRFFRMAFWSVASVLALGVIGFGLPGLVNEIHGTPPSSGEGEGIFAGAASRPRTVGEAEDNNLVPVTVRGVISQPGMDAPAVVLATEDGKRLLPIFIGHAEALAILRNLNQVELPRPMTHDLMLAVMQHLGGKVDRVIVTRLDQGTFYADLVIGMPEDKKTVLDARPSDSIALAVKAEADIFVARKVLDEVGYTPEDPDDEDLPLPPPESLPEQPRMPI